MPVSMPSLNDDKGNPINVRKNPVEDLLSLKNNGQQKGIGGIDPSTNEPIPRGFTPESDYFVNAGEVDTTIEGLRSLPQQGNPTNDKLWSDLDYSYYKRSTGSKEMFYNSEAQQDFIHELDGLDNKNTGQAKEIIPNPVGTSRDIYLSSFLSTRSGNEDPTMLGWDIEIEYDSSPLFNGSIENFISQYPNVTELQSRLDILIKFKEQFYKFFKVDTKNSIDPLPPNKVKVYYLKKLTGLDKLVDSNVSNDHKKSFVKYGDDFINITVNEDVDQNMGYLSALYKSLSWSRINGRQIIPENLLRFNLKITLTEIRKFNRVIKMQNDTNLDYPDLSNPTVNINNGKVAYFADLISKYAYTLYECQMFFPKLPHNDSLDLSSPVYISDYDFQFNYKFSTLKFEKFSYNTGINANYDFIDNKFVDVTKLTPRDSSASDLSNRVDLSKKDYNYQFLGKTLDKTGIVDVNSNPAVINSKNAKPNPLKDSISQFGKDLLNSGVKEVNRRVITQARLLNKTIDNIRNSIPMAGRMGAPVNVYSDEPLLLSDIQNSIRGFVGRSLKGFFG